MSTLADPALGVVLRGPDADGLRVASFGVDLRRAVPAAEPVAADETARAAGYAHGWAQGRRDAALAQAQEQAAQRERDRVADADRQVALQRALQGIDAAAAALHRDLAPAVAALEEVLLDAGYELAEALLGRELCTGTPGRDAVARAMALVPADGPVTVRLHPADLATLSGTDESTVEHRVLGRLVTLVADPALGTGDAVARCASSTVDARLAGALARVRQALA